jgi:hypothetical protein
VTEARRSRDDRFLGMMRNSSLVWMSRPIVVLVTLSVKRRAKR